MSVIGRDVYLFLVGILAVVILSFPVVALDAPVVTYANNTSSDISGSDNTEMYRLLSSGFIPNMGQYDPEVAYVLQYQRTTIFFTRTGLVLTHTSENDEGSSGDVIRQTFGGASSSTRITAQGERSGRVNYYVGNGSSEWLTGIPVYAEIVYNDLYPGIDLVYSEENGRLKREFQVAPGASPSNIELLYDEEITPSVDDDGILRFASPAGEMLESPLICWQVIGGERISRTATYLVEEAAVRIVVDGYDPGYELIIDPELVYSTYLGGSDGDNDCLYGGDSDAALAPDGSGGVWVAGYTGSSNFPVTADAFQGSHGGDWYDVFLSRFSSTGALLYSTYLGGSGWDIGYALAPDGSGGVWVAGYTRSSNFPVTADAFQGSHNGGTIDAFVARFSSTGALLYSTYLGGSGRDNGNALAPDGAGGVWVAGDTSSTDFPVTADAYQSSYGGLDNDGFIARFSSTGALLYSTYLGGSGVEDNNRLALAPDGSGGIWVTGDTSSTDFPVTDNAYQGSNGGVSDVFVSRFSSTGALLYSTYIGGSGNDQVTALAPDGTGGVWVTGHTLSTDFPVTADAFQGSLGKRYFFVARFSSTGAFLYSTYLGESNLEYGDALAPDGTGGVWVTGHTFSSDFPVTADAYQSILGGHSDAFVSHFSSKGTLIYSTYLGGSAGDSGHGLAPDGSGGIWVTGDTSSTDFPVTDNAYQGSNGGTSDIWVVKLNQNEIYNPTITSLTPSSITAGSDAFTLQITGTNFVNGAKVLWDGEERATVFVSATELTATILKEDVAAPGIWKVKVVGPDGRVSNQVEFAIIQDAAGAVWIQMIGNAEWAARSAHSSMPMPDGSIVLMGGSTGENFYNDVWRSMDYGASWTQITENAEWSPRAHFSSVVMPDGSIVLMGGHGSEGFSNDVWRSIDFGASWTQITENAEWSPRAHFSSVVMPDGSIVLMGGHGSEDFSNDVWRSTDYGASWTQITDSAEWSSRFCQSGVVMPDGSIVIMGGGQHDGLINDVWRSTDFGASWTQMSQSASWSRRNTISAVTMNGHIVIMGGDDPEGCKNDVWQSMNNGATWTQLTANAEWAARTEHSNVVLPDGNIVIMGGQGSDNNHMNDVWRWLPVEPESPPTITTLTPSSITAGCDAFTLEVTGTNFIDGAKVLWGGQERETQFVSSTELTATILAEDVTDEGTYRVKVVNPDGTVSVEEDFEVIFEPGDVRLNVPLYSQANPAWASDTLGTGIGTIGLHGCAITSTSMVFSYFGVDVNPKLLNQWLIDNDGYDIDAIIWAKAADFNSDINYIGWFGSDTNLIKAEIDSGNPVIANVRLFGENHFVVITGYNADTFYINDPADGTERTLADSRYDTTSGQRIYSIRIYHGADEIESQTPLPISPGTRTPPGNLVNTLTPSFSWQGIPLAEGYRLYVSECDKNGEIINPLIFVAPSLSDPGEPGILGTEYSDLTSGTLEWGKNYCWNVEPKIAGTWSKRYSPINYFKTDSLLNQAISRERIYADDVIVTVADDQYIIATLQNKIDSETLESIPDSGRTTVYLNMAGAPVSDGYVAQKIGLIEDARSIDFEFDSRITQLQLYDAGSTGIDKLIMTKGIIGKISTYEEGFQSSKMYWDWYNDEIWQVGITDQQRVLEAAKKFPTESILVDLAVFAIENSCGNPYEEAKEDTHEYLSRSIENYEKAAVINNKEIIDDASAFSYLYNVYYGRHFDEVSYYLLTNIYRNAEVYIIEFEPISGALSSKIPLMSLFEFPKLVEKAFLGLDWQLDTGMLDITGTYKTNADLEYKLSEAAEYSLQLASAEQEIGDYKIKHAEKVAEGSQLASEAADATVDYLMGVDVFHFLWEIKTKIESINIFSIFSPGEPRIYDSTGRVTGLVNGEIREEIPESAYHAGDNTIVIFNATDLYTFKVVGTDEGEYGIDVVFIENQSLQDVKFSGINISNNSVHEYSFDWNMLATGGNGILLNKDLNGDDVYEESIITYKPYVPSNPVPQNSSTDVSLSPELKWQGGDPDPQKDLIYSVYLGTNETPPLISILDPAPSSQENLSYSPTTLNSETKYYWYVTVRDNYGITETSPLWHFITTTNPPLFADFTTNATSGQAPLPIHFTDNSTGSITSHLWSFGDGTTPENETEVTHTYLQPGNYTVTLTVSGPDGEDSVSQAIQVTDETIAKEFLVQLNGGWNIFSTPVKLEPGKSTFGEIFSPTEQQKIQVVLGWDEGYWFIPDPSAHVDPLYAYFIKIEDDTTATAVLVPSESVTALPSRQLNEGINLIGPAPAYDENSQVFQTMPVDQGLVSIENVGDLIGYVIVVSPNINQPGWAYAKGGQVKDLLPFKGYWITMENGPDTMYGFSTTPILY